MRREKTHRPHRFKSVWDQAGETCLSGKKPQHGSYLVPAFFHLPSRETIKVTKKPRRRSKNPPILRSVPVTMTSLFPPFAPVEPLYILFSNAEKEQDKTKGFAAFVECSHKLRTVV